MLRFQFTLGAVLAMAAVAGTQAVVLAQTPFKNPTHPTLLEVTAPAVTAPQQSQSPLPVSQSNQLPVAPAMPSRGQIAFSHPPRLVRATASQLAANTPSTYEFTLNVPADAGQPMKAVTIAQAVNLETVQFNVGQSRAFAGGRFAAGPEIPLASVGGEQPTNSGAATIVFEQPVQPGTTVTVAIPVTENPSLGGVYEFGITAYPAGENNQGQFLGYRRINLYGNSN